MLRKAAVFVAFAACLAMTVGCASIKRFLTVDSGYNSVSKLDSLYHPAGRLVAKTYASSAVCGPSARRLLVYLPAGYDESDRRYPVLYLIHGARGNEESWIKDGELLPVMDSLTAAGECEPCIVVLPNMNQYDDDADFGQSRFKRPIESFFEIDGTVETVFRDDVVRNIDADFRTIADKEHRAIAGLSVGGLQTIYVSAANPELFDYVGLFSPMFQAAYKHGEYSSLFGMRKLLEMQKKQFAEAPRLYMIFAGRADVLYGHIEDYRYYLKINGFPFSYQESGGGHNWVNWRKYFDTFVKLQFK